MVTGGGDEDKISRRFTIAIPTLIIGDEMIQGFASKEGKFRLKQ